MPTPELPPLVNDIIKIAAWGMVGVWCVAVATMTAIRELSDYAPLIDLAGAAVVILVGARTARRIRRYTGENKGDE